MKTLLKIFFCIVKTVTICKAINIEKDLQLVFRLVLSYRRVPEM